MSALEGRLGLTPDNQYYCLPKLEAKRVLEVGCNVGLLARHILRNLKPREYRGIDPYQAHDQTPELRPHWRYGDIQRRDTLPYGEKWDVVVCFDVLYHLLSPLEGLLNLHQLTGECLVLGTAVIPEGEWCYSPNYPMEPHVARGPLLRFAPGYRGDNTNYLFPTESCLLRMLEWAGFRRLERKYHFPETKMCGFFCDRVCYHCHKN
jgi:SAM-dependent methyltransferase